ncbi:Fic family protein [Quadrisphaera granulorum]|uniref:Fic family protein n=1 Tax=Quadrisphaera granulorum TaxID=317664 RepID=A0A315ZX99_9ACTN|nr:Fic family protein [Quadrisphaera granulorum]PWJ50276.1 Fic family protein [Quadrisphaera granulorum]SZE98042.1 Fic family protein [Quadrisphaera granulorum]
MTAAQAARLRVPPHGTEVLPWRRQDGRRSEITEYAASIPPKISELDLDVPAGLLEACRAAQVEIGVLERRWADAVSVLEPFLLRTEAIASSRIEDELTTVDQLARVQHGLSGPRSARTVMGAVVGLRLLVERAARGVELDDLLAAHRLLMANDPHERHDAGRLRTVQNWISGSDRSPLGAVHVPPAPAHVPELMDDLLAFMRRTDLDPVVQAAVAHAHFESIHPFNDGNGRIGRSLVNAVWRYRGVTARIAVPIASAIVADREEYFSLVNLYRTGDAHAFCGYPADATTRSAAEAEVSAQRLLGLPGRWREHVRPRSGSATDELLNLLPGHPVVDATDVARLTGASAARAYVAIERLVEAEVLRPITASKRGAAWAAGDVLDEADLLVDRLRLRRLQERQPPETR